MTQPLRHPVVILPGEPVLEIAGVQQSSAVDGPGNRFVVFLQGCNFDCIACHNPSTIGRCDACGACVDSCPHGALSSPTSGVVVYTEAPCDRCRACIAPCPIDSDPAIRVSTASELLEEIRPVAPFITGITVTGGEPTMQLDGLVALFSAAKADPDLSHLTTLVDSNGTLNERGWRRLLPVLDGAMIDLKAGDTDLHERITGHGNESVLESIRFLSSHGRLTEVRLLVIEEVTDTDDELNAWAALIRDVDPDVPVRAMAFRHQGTRLPARDWPETSKATMQRVHGALANLGLARVLPN